MTIANNSRIFADGNRTICDNAFIGVGTIIVYKECITIGENSMISEYVVIRDQDHDIRHRPMKDGGLISTPIVSGQDVWIGCKASVIRGGSIGDHCVIGAHALVRTHIPDESMAVGVPARVIR